MLRAELKRHREKVVYSDNLPATHTSPHRPVRVADVLREINHFLAQQKKFLVVAESGDSLFGGIDIKVGNDGLYLAQGFYASMGFAIPGALGAQIGTGLRPLILTGDGGFQMTGVEIAHAPRYRLNPIVVLLNNGGWGIFRPVVKRQDLLALPSWRYAELARLWGGRGFRVETVGQLRRALEQAANSSAFTIVEVMIGPKDLSPVSVKYIRASAKKAQLQNSHLACRQLVRPEPATCESQTDHTVSSDGKNAPLRLSNVIEEKPWNANISVSQLELILQKTSKICQRGPHPHACSRFMGDRPLMRPKFDPFRHSCDQRGGVEDFQTPAHRKYHRKDDNAD